MDNPKELFERALKRVLPTLDRIVRIQKEPWTVYRRSGENSWSSATEERPDLLRTLVTAEHLIEQEAEPIRDWLQNEHSHYLGQIHLYGMNSTPSQSKTYPLAQLLDAYWRTYKTFALADDRVTAIAESSLEVIKTNRVKVRVVAPLRNLVTAVHDIKLTNELSLFQMSEELITQLHGGPVWSALMNRRSTFFLFEDHALTGETDIALQFGAPTDPVDLSQLSLHPELNRAILAMRLLKDGAVAYDRIHHSFIGFSPVPANFPTTIAPEAPLSLYDLSQSDAEQLPSIVSQLDQSSDQAFYLAARRLSDAQLRTSPEDRILDAVTGLEAILLSAIYNAEDRGEKSYRCSLHYACLGNSPDDKMQRFRTLKDLYGHRSTIAHGDLLGNSLKVGSKKKLSPKDVSDLACAALRETLMHFLPHLQEAPFRKMEYWYGLIFGQSASTGQSDSVADE
jgi:hypothetical protein